MFSWQTGDLGTKHGRTVNERNMGEHATNHRQQNIFLGGPCVGAKLEPIVQMKPDWKLDVASQCTPRRLEYCIYIYKFPLYYVLLGLAIVPFIHFLCPDDLVCFLPASHQMSRLPWTSWTRFTVSRWVLPGSPLFPPRTPRMCCSLPQGTGRRAALPCWELD